uniref:(California timema) hypothetical protein n=1 Tax=Timema californicum TaxID=61474 RepID=A0A7R9PBM7_TIMCA|nr:unnamed protein product [Timema californicum]
MNIPLTVWSSLTLVLFVTTFGFWWFVNLAFSLLLFLVGGFTLLYLKHEDATQNYFTNMYRSSLVSYKTGLCKVVEEPPVKLKLDRRLTGSQVIDESLQEIIGYILRDYISPWYDRVSANEEFPHHIRQTSQKVIVTFAGRMKEVDWIPYLTTRLVDDAASHLRLFRQARAKMKQKIRQSSKHSDKHADSSQDAGKDRAISAKPTELTPGGGDAGSSSSGSSAGKQTPVELESVFFDLEVTMEDNLLCRDLVCTEIDNGRQYMQDLGEILLYLLLPVEDFHCKPLRFLLRELLVSVVVLPLFGLFSDPDYLNQIIIWLCKDVPMTSEAFLTVLRATDNIDELNATREMVTKEIAQLRSRDSGGDEDTSVKQQLSSLLYVRKVIDNRTQRLQEGSDTDSAESDDSRPCTPPSEEAQAAMLCQYFDEVQKEGHNVKAKNVKGVTYGNLEQTIIEWFSQHRAQNVPINGLMMQRKADKFALRRPTASSQPSPSMEPQVGPSMEPQPGSTTAPWSPHLTFTWLCDEETWQRLAPDCTYEEYISADDIIVWGTLDDADIIMEQQESSDEEGEEEMEEEPEDIPTTKDVLNAGDVYSRALKHQGASEELWSQFYNVKYFVGKTGAKNKQTSIMDFFKK